MSAECHQARALHQSKSKAGVRMDEYGERNGDHPEYSGHSVVFHENEIDVYEVRNRIERSIATNHKTGPKCC